MKRSYILLALCFCTLPILAQIKIGGHVLDEQGEPVPFANIVLRDTGSGVPVGTATDMDGKFTLEVPRKGMTVDVSFVGYQDYSFVVEKEMLAMTIHLKPASSVLDETIIVGFATQKKINATGAVKTIGSEALESRPISNAVQGLQGVVAGFNITNDNGGALGEAMAINIRGVGSIGEGSNSAPLILIDGMEGDLSTLNPNDIESVSVLKDGASAAIYGSRAPFGVVLVTTKSGRQGFSVNYRNNTRMQQPVSVPDMVDAYTYALMMNEAYANSGGNPPFGSVQLGRIKDYMDGKLEYGTMAYENQNEWMKNQASFGNTDWYDHYVKDLTTSQEHNLSVSGARKAVDYYFSANYMGQTGLFNYANERLDRLAANGKVGFKITPWMKLNWNTRYVHQDNEKPSALNALFYHNLGRRAPNATLLLPNGDYTTDSMMEAILHGGREANNKRQLYNQATLQLTPVKGLKVTAEVSNRYEANPYSKDFNPISHRLPDGTPVYLQVLEGVSSKHSINANGTFAINPAAGETYREHATNKVNYWSTNVYANYDLSLGEKHNFTFLLGEQSEYYHYRTDRLATTDADLGADAEASTLQSWREGEWASLGFFGRVNYNYMLRYLIEVNLRADGASRFPTDQRWGVFPAVSVGWNIAEERFWKPLRTYGFDYLKLRASVATLGNQNTTSFYPYYQQMNTLLGSLVTNGSQATVLPMYAPFSTSLTWERIENLGAGIDWGFFNNRFTGSFDLYQRTTKGMVGPANALSAVYGASAPKTNNASLRTRGWELELGWRDRIGKDFSYSVSGMLSDYRTVVTEYESPDNKIGGWYKGKEFGEIWGFETVGIAKSDAEMYAYLAEHSQSSIGTKWGGGDMMYRDIDDDGSVDRGSETLGDHGDLKVIGNSTPRYAYSFTIDAQWRWLDVRAFFQGIGKRDFFFTNSATFFGIAAEWQRSLYAEHLDYFRYAGSKLGANYENPYYARLRIDQNNIQVSDHYLQDASYLRFKNLQIGVNLPAERNRLKWIERGRLYVSVENLFTWTRLRIYDPEAVGNFENWGPGKTYPQYRTYSIGLDVTF